MAIYAPVTEAEAAHYEMLAAERDFSEAYADMQTAGGHDYRKEYAVTSAGGYAGAATAAYYNALEVQFKYPEPNEFHTILSPDWAVVAEWQYDIHGQEKVTKPPTRMNDFGVKVLRDFYDSCVKTATRSDGGEVQARVDQHFADNGTLHMWHYDARGTLWHRAEIRISRP